VCQIQVPQPAYRATTTVGYGQLLPEALLLAPAFRFPTYGRCCAYLPTSSAANGVRECLSARNHAGTKFGFAGSPLPAQARSLESDSHRPRKSLETKAQSIHW
jgi:hypothetical protein